MINIQTQYIKVYRDGELSRWETIKPLIHSNIMLFGNSLDLFFKLQHWPTRQELQAELAVSGVVSANQ